MVEAIKASCEALETKIKTVINDDNLLRADQWKLAERVKTNETSISELKPAAESSAIRIQELHDRLHSMEKRMGDLEGRDRRSNI